MKSILTSLALVLSLGAISSFTFTPKNELLPTKKLEIKNANQEYYKVTAQTRNSGENYAIDLYVKAVVGNYGRSSITSVNIRKNNAYEEISYYSDATQEPGNYYVRYNYETYYFSF